jgi:hypothetical protein
MVRHVDGSGSFLLGVLLEIAVAAGVVVFCACGAGSEAPL